MAQVPAISPRQPQAALGDKVRRRSGGPVMLVVDIHDAAGPAPTLRTPAGLCDTAADEDFGVSGVTCAWEVAGRRFERFFPCDRLLLVCRMMRG